MEMILIKDYAIGVIMMPKARKSRNKENGR